MQLTHIRVWLQFVYLLNLTRNAKIDAVSV